jgi:hypothetical protein
VAPVIGFPKAQQLKQRKRCQTKSQSAAEKKKRFEFTSRDHRRREQDLADEEEQPGD